MQEQETAIERKDENKKPSISITAETHIDENEQLNYEGVAHNYDPVPRDAEIMKDTLYIQERVDSQISWYDRKSSENKKNYQRMKKAESYLAATVPILITFSAAVPSFVPATWYLDKWLQLFATLGGVAVVILNKLQELGTYHKLWKEYRYNSEELQREKYLYITKTEPYDEKDAFPRFVEKIEHILSSETKKWHLSQQQGNNNSQKRQQNYSQQWQMEGDFTKNQQQGKKNR
ncbi:DUF4231 domain-containing protein [Algivirga pacifica]|uniref:DUF4231 domain-containing protein n=1 Tax=Algivirga pacifica TaxID=1162670 RepID=A0ABP9D5I8_9BACT